MNAAWKIKIHKLVLSEDFKPISHPDRNTILKAIRKKLSIDPKAYGKPLARNLKGYWRIRVGDYRVIYKIKEQLIEVLVVKIGIRRDEEVYREMLNRLKRLQDSWENN